MQISINTIKFDLIQENMFPLSRSANLLFGFTIAWLLQLATAYDSSEDKDDEKEKPYGVYGAGDRVVIQRDEGILFKRRVQYQG